MGGLIGTDMRLLPLATAVDDRIDVISSGSLFIVKLYDDLCKGYDVNMLAYDEA